MTDDPSPSNSIISISSGVNLDAERIVIGGDVVGRDKIIQNIQNIDQRARTAAEEAEQARAFEAQRLAQGVSAFAQRLQARAGESTDASKGGPYKGLLEYRLSDAEIFFGRDNAIRELLEHLQRGPLTVLHAESGAGKTSLLQAGLSPHLIAAGHLPIYLRPYNVAPALALKRAFLPNLSDTPNLTQAPLRDFLARVGDVLGAGTTLYIFLDQFEEVFTQLEETARPEFVRELADCLDDESLNVRWVLALRSEFFGNLASFRPRIRNPFENDYRLNRLTRDEAHEAVAKPAARRGISFEEGLIDTILGDLGKDEVEPPQVQLVCSTLYEALPSEAKLITRELYVTQGGAAGILRGHLGRVLKRLPAEQRPIAQHLLEELITSDMHRMMRTRAELANTLTTQSVKAETLDTVLGQLVDSRLLRVEESEGEPAYELAHDYLLSEISIDPAVQARKAAQELLEQEIRAYQRYKTLLTADRLQVIEPYAADLRLTLEAQQLLADSRVAVQHEREEEEARRQKELDDARKLAEAQRLRAEEQTRSAAKLRRRALYLTGALAFALVLGVTAVILGVQANQLANEAQLQAHIALSRQLVVQAQSHSNNHLDLGLLLSVEADRAIDTVEARSNLLHGLQLSPRLETFSRGHTGAVFAVAFSPDRKTLASGGFDDKIILWDVSNPEAPQQLGAPLAEHTYPVTSLTFSSDGKTLASGSGDKTIILWDVSNPQAPKMLNAPLVGQTDSVFSVAFSPDNKVLASSSCGNEDSKGTCTQGEIILWNVSNPDAPQRLGTPLTGHTDYVLSVTFSPDGKLLASASWDKTIILWDVSDPKAPKALSTPLVGHNDKVYSVAFSSDGKTLASGSSDNTMILWDISNPSVPQMIGTPLTAHTGFVGSVVFSPDGKTLASGSGDNTIILSDVSNPKVPIPLGAPLVGHSGAVYSVAFSPDGKTLASGSEDNTIILWDVSSQTVLQPSGTLLPKLSSAVHSVTFSPDGKTLASSDTAGGIILWDLSNPKMAKQLGPTLIAHTAPVQSVAFSPDGKTLASGGGNGLFGADVILWDVTNPPVPQMLSAPLTGPVGPEDSYAVNSAAFSPDGKTLALGSGNKTIILSDVSNPNSPVQLGAPLVGHTGGVESVAFSPDGKTLASGSADGTIVLWSISSSQMPQQLGAPLTRHMRGVLSVTFSPDGKKLASGGEDMTTIMWDVSNPKAPIELGTPLSGHSSPVSSVAFSPDSKILASASNDTTIILWDVSNPKSPVELGTPLSGHRGEVWSVAFSPDGKMLASGSEEGTIILWDVDVASWQARACQISGRNLTRAEWQQYMGDEPYRKTCEQWPLEPEVTPTPSSTLTP